MQQTETYKLNKPGMDDTFSVEPLNKNADKLEAELARVDAVAAALDQRVVKLENCRMIIGTYKGSNSSSGKDINLGERPAALFVHNLGLFNSTVTGLLTGDSKIAYGNSTLMYLTDNGFHVYSDLNQIKTYCFLAFFGDWPTKSIF